MKKLLIIALLITLVVAVIWRSPLRSKFEYLGYRVGILRIDSCVEFGLPPQGGVQCSYKFDPQALWERLTSPKRINPPNQPNF